MSVVLLQSVSKLYDKVAAVDCLSLAVPEGDLVALLGPSGCGKTTTLRMIGGFVDVSEGRIIIGGRDVTDLPAAKRNIGFGFQNYALFPHMTVEQNVGFGLEMRRKRKPDIARSVAAMLELVRLGPLAKRLPKQLSGGQQQRVALARALVVEPDVLLLDEPLSNLDAQLRQDMKSEIRALQRSLGITTIFVTHDQDEALTIADHIVVMRAGCVEQQGSPEAVFAEPRSRFVAEFMGFTNLIEGTLKQPGCFELPNGESIPVRLDAPYHGPLALAIRPEQIDVEDAATAPDSSGLKAQITRATFRGTVVDYKLRTPSGLELTVRRPAPNVGGSPLLKIGHPVIARWAESASHFLVN